VLAVLAAGFAPGARADTPSDVAAGLSKHNYYLSPRLPAQAHQAPGDLQRLIRQTDNAGNRGITELIAVTDVVPRNVHTPAQAASSLRNYLDLSNSVLVLVTPLGIALASDIISPTEETSIAQKARPRCTAESWAACAVYAGQLAVTQARADKNSSFRDAIRFWVIVLIILGLVILGLVYYFRRRARTAARNLEELRTAALNTLSTADGAIEQIESSGKQLTNEVRTQYDRALGLRDRARNGIEAASSTAAMVQANEDAAQAVLALQGVMRAVGIEAPLTSALDVPEHRCFYCGRTDRPPYVARTIDDGRGNSMEVEICAVDQARLAQGRTPRIATVQYGGAAVPWWAVPSSPFYYAYGGPTWQYWLPFLVGIDVGSWFGGGWGGYAFGSPVYDDFGWQGGSSFDPGGQAPADAGGAAYGGWGDTSQTPDAGGADFGGWGDASQTGDSGGGDWGGGDSGGSDFGGGGSDSGW
jgi:hypothetical protein